MSCCLDFLQTSLRLVSKGTGRRQLSSLCDMRHTGPAPGKLTHQGPRQEVTGGAFHHPRGRTGDHAGRHYRQGFNPCVVVFFS